MRVVITGANRGIGLELARQYLARGDEVHAAVRAPERATALNALAAAASKRLKVGACDVADDASVRAFAASVSGPLDVLINNAGVYGKQTGAADALEAIDFSDARATFEVNALGAVRVTCALLPQLRRARGAKIANISSGLGSIAGNTSGGGWAYRMSKAALNMASRSMAAELRGDGIAVVALSPGWVQTDMGGAGAPTPVNTSAAGVIAIIDRLALQESCGFFDYQGERLDW